MPARNAELYIADSIRSVLNGLPLDATLVVLDDASSDSTVEHILAACAADKRVSIIQMSENLGVARALNLLIDRTDSVLVARMDADDVSLSNRFSRQLSLLDRADAVFSPAVWVSPRGWPTGAQAPLPLGTRGMGLMLLLGNFLVHDSLLVRRSVLEEVGGYRAAAAEDYDLWLRMINSGCRTHLDWRPQVLVRRHPGRTMSQSAWAERLAADASSRQLFEAYSANALMMIGEADVPIEWFTFAMYTRSYDDHIAPLLERIYDESGSLPLIERLAIRRALRVARNRIT